MKRTRTTFAVLAIILLMASAFGLGGALPVAVLAVAVLVLPLTPTLPRPWAVASVSLSDTLARSLALLRAPPAASNR